MRMNTRTQSNQPCCSSRRAYSSHQRCSFVRVRAVASFVQQQQRAFALTGSSLDAAESDLGWKTDFYGNYTKGKLIGAGSFGQVSVCVQVADVADSWR